MLGNTQLARKSKPVPALPAHLGADTVDNPYEVGPAKIVVLRNYRDDPLAVMLARRQIDRAQFEAGRSWQKLYRDTELIPVKAMDPTKEPVDGGGNIIEALTDRKLEAMKRLSAIGAKLGHANEKMLERILIGGMSIKQYAHLTGFPTAKHVKATAARFRAALEMLAREFGYA